MAIYATYARPAQPSPSIGMASEECGQEATGRAEGWEAHLVDLDDGGPDEVIVYCPDCANWFERSDPAG